MIRDQMDDIDYKAIMARAKRWAATGIAGVVGAALVYSAPYTVKNDEAAVITRFGAYARTEAPGLHFRMPLIEDVIRVPTSRMQKIETGFRTVESGITSSYISQDTINDNKVPSRDLENMVEETGVKVPSGDKLREAAKNILKDEYLMLTGDLFMVDVESVTQYTIEDPVKYAFNIQDAKHTVKDLLLSTLRSIVGNSSVDEVISLSRDSIRQQAEKIIQATLDDYDSGIRVTRINLQSTNPPFNVRPSYNQVSKAMQNKATKIQKAQEDYNKEVPRAFGEAQKAITEAEGYAIERVNNARGNVARFEALMDEYHRSPEVTRQRLYFETMDRMRKNANITIVDERIGNMLNLNQVGGSK
jgi:modulator of FtsH protease HflK